MKAKIVICSVIVLMLFTFFTSIVFAECEPVTMINPAGKVKEMCVSENAVGQIGGPGDVVIPAICPCFSVEDIEDAFTSYDNPICYLLEGYTKITNEPCSLVDCYDDNIDLIVSASEGPPGVKPESGSCQFDRGWVMLPPFNRCNLNGNAMENLPEEQGDACVAILETFVQ